MLLTLILAVIIIFLVYANVRRPHNFPPGPLNLPVIGYIPFMTRKPHVKLWQLSLKYGHVFSIHLGSYRVVVLSSLASVKEGFKEDALNGRPDFPFFVSRSNGKGILFSQGLVWQEMRRFTLRNLRDFGFGKSTLEGIIQDEIWQLVQFFKAREGEPLDLQNRFGLAVVNALWMIVSGHRFDHDDVEATRVVSQLTEQIGRSSSSPIPMIMQLMPWLSKCFQKRSKRVMAHVDNLRAIVLKIVEEHQKVHTHGDDFDLIHVFLNRIEETQDPESPFFKEQGLENLIIVLLDLFSAGSETTSTTLLWLFLILATHPEVQKRIQKEIDAACPLEQLPSYAQKVKMPYTEAVLMEVMRFASLVPLGTMHAATKDIKFMGFDIPKGTLIMSNLYQVLHDSKHWKRPWEFYPEHFLNENGSFKNVDASIPFSVGKRNCLGESLAKMELFLFATGLLQRFTFELPAGEPKPSLEPKTTIIFTPHPYRVIVRSRKPEELFT